MTEQKNGKLYTRIANVTSLLAGKLRADKRHEQQRYDYLSADQILQAVGNAMADNGVVVVPGVISSDSGLIEPTNKKPFFNATVSFIMYVSDIDGNVFETPWIGMGADYTAPDKAIYKAITSGHKYFLMKLFNIGIGNMDSEHDTDDTNQANTPPTVTKKANVISVKPAVSDDQRKPTEPMRKKLWASGKALYGDEWDDTRATIVGAVTKGRTTSSKQITWEECKTLIDGIEKKANE